MDETFQSAMLMRTLELSENSSNSSTVHESEAKLIKIVGQHDMNSVAFSVDGGHVVSGSSEGKIQCWRAEDGKEVGTPIDATSETVNIAVSRDGKWIVSGTKSGELTVWDAESHKKVARWKGHSKEVVAVDISPDGTRVATGSYDCTACIWSLSTGLRLLGPLEHNFTVTTAKFSPDGCLIATAAWQSVRVYNVAENGRLLINFPNTVAGKHNSESLVWANESKHLFTLSFFGKINHLDVSTGTALSSWPIHGGGEPGCIALAKNGTLIAASAGRSVSFWDTATYKQVGSIVKHKDLVRSMAISANYDLVIGGGRTITLWRICKVLPSSYHKDVSAIPCKIRCGICS